MARAATKRLRVVETPIVVEPLAPKEPITPALLRNFGKGDAEHKGFSFTRYWYEGPGAREGITGWVHKKMRPGDHPQFGWAAKSEVLLPPNAPGDYASQEFLLQRFDETLPPFESHIMIQTRLALDPNRPWHAGYEHARAFARDHFATRFPVIMVAHVPGIAGLEGYGNHVHCIVLARPLGIDGLGGTCHRLCSDKGYDSALAAWRDHGGPRRPA
jgi:hypothetical protein